MDLIKNKKQCSHNKHTAFTSHLLHTKSQYKISYHIPVFLSTGLFLLSAWGVYSKWLMFSAWTTLAQNPASVNTQCDLLWEIQVWSAVGNLHLHRKLCWMSVREFSGTQCSRVCGENEFNPKLGSVGTAWFISLFFLFEWFCSKWHHSHSFFDFA